MHLSAQNFLHLTEAFNSLMIYWLGHAPQQQSHIVIGCCQRRAIGAKVYVILA